MYVVCGNLGLRLCKIDHFIHIHWCIPMGHNDPWVESHMRPQQMWGQRSSRCDLNRSGVKGHLGLIDLLIKFLRNSHCIHILWCITMGIGLILHWLQKYVIAKAGETRDSRTALFISVIKIQPLKLCHHIIKTGRPLLLFSSSLLYLWPDNIVRTLFINDTYQASLFNSTINETKTQV